MMEIQQEVENGVTVLALRGSLDAPTAPVAEQAFTTLLRAGARHVVLDLSAVEYISSGGIRVVIMLNKALGKAGGELKLCGLSPFVAEVFNMTHLSSVFEIYADRPTALQRFSVPL